MRMFGFRAAGLVLIGVSFLSGPTRADDRGVTDRQTIDSQTIDSETIDSKGNIVAIIDQARLVRVPDGTETLLIGNATIADLTMLRQKNLAVLTPKAFGETNFIALDHDGTPLAASTIQVIGGMNAVVVQRGMDRESYSCAPRCQPTERLGDDEKYLSAVASQAQAHSQRLAGVTPPTGVSLPSH